jgi:hypothetical protein
MLLVLPSHRCPQGTEELSQLFRGGVALPFRHYLASLRACEAALAGDGTITAAAAQWQASDAAALDVMAGLGASASMMMAAR